MLVLVPLKIRASLTQDFAKSFDFGFVKRFVMLTWKEMVLSSLFVMATGFLFLCLGMIVFCVGDVFCHRADLLFLDAHEQTALHALSQPRR